ncbi:MAG TPA: vWA domain-containing protein, partial [Polyangiaceae bacterium]|nr:vWA domain-containing protein [Polyangiaceae bacterium]
FERVTPTVVLLIDRSASMTQAFDNGLDRWETLVQTLTDPQSSLIEKLDTSVRFGMALYSSDDGFGTGPTPRQCPVLASVDISIGNFDSMSTLLTSNQPRGDTPTAESLEAIVAQLQAFDEDGPKSIILATDGDPDTCEDPDANDDDASKARSVAAVTAAFGAGVSTHVISVGDEVTASHLKALAVAGSGGDDSAEAFTALDTQGLVDAFTQIIGSVRTCDFTLQGSVAADDAPRGNVVVDGEALVFDDPNGWTMPDESTVRLQGEACEAIQADATGISMSFPCDAIEIIPR